MKQEPWQDIKIPIKDNFGNLIPFFCRECGKRLEVDLGRPFHFQRKITQSINLCCPKYGSFWSLIRGKDYHTYSKQVAWYNAPTEMNAKYNSQTGERIN